ELVIHAPPPVPVQRLDDENILAAHINQRSHLMFAVFEFSLFVRAQGDAEMGADPFAEITAGAGGEDRNLSTIHWMSLLSVVFADKQHAFSVPRAYSTALTAPRVTECAGAVRQIRHIDCINILRW